ncbi:hypothetical protein TIFTF001_012296 [Ficus carica]|uniref:Uncharacterized protein n=1 Tax=Ficus carica TaxID=3494 RepID=A0AA88AN31_FICCA|nr:hypothetical protein TIFTF001_012296 [Ficus carica]
MQADDSGSQGGFFVDPSSNSSLDNGLSIRACLGTMCHGQERFRRQRLFGFVVLRFGNG